jgi:hypothetical protein
MMLKNLKKFVTVLVKYEVGIVANNGVRKITVFEVRKQRRNGISLVDMLSTHTLSPPTISSTP